MAEWVEGDIENGGSYRCICTETTVDDDGTLLTCWCGLYKCALSDMTLSVIDNSSVAVDCEYARDGGPEFGL